MPQVIVQRGSSLQGHYAFSGVDYPVIGRAVSDKGSFRRPFYFGFDKVIQLLPPRVRTDDIPLLAFYFPGHECPEVRLSCAHDLAARLEATAGNIYKATKLLGWARQTMINKLDRYGIPRHYGDPDYAQERQDG